MPHYESIICIIKSNAHYIAVYNAMQYNGLMKISHNNPESESNTDFRRSESRSEVIKLDDFMLQTSRMKSKSHLQLLIAHLVRETNKYKLDYLQLKYIFKSVRAKCKVEVPKPNKRLYELPTIEELHKFYGSIQNPTHRLIFEVLQGTGLRVSELCGLEVKQIDFSQQTIFVKNGKGSKDRVTVFGNKLKEKLQLYLHGKPNRYLFESARHSKFSSRRIQQLHEQYRKPLHLSKKFTVHTFRHLWNTNLAQNGIGREIREILSGHSKGSKVQDIYTHLTIDGQKDKVIGVLE